MAHRRITKAVFAAILLGLLLFLSNTGFVSSVEEKFLKTIKQVLSRALILKQILAGSSTEEYFEDLRETADKMKIESLTLENSSLRKALRFSEERLALEGSRVIYYRVEFGKEFLFIDRGIKEGVKKGDMAIDSLGFLVGVVKESNEAGSHVEIISNPGQTLEVEILPLQIRALARGIGARTLALELLPQGLPLRKGDAVYLLGIGVARRSLPVGEIVSTGLGKNSAFTEARAFVSTKPETLREVFVIK